MSCLSSLTSSNIRFCDTPSSQHDALYEFLLFPHSYMVAPGLLGNFLARLLLADTTWRDVFKPGQTWWYDATCMHVKSKGKGCRKPQLQCWTLLVHRHSSYWLQKVLSSEKTLRPHCAPHKTLVRHNQQLTGEHGGTLNSKRASYVPQSPKTEQSCSNCYCLVTVTFSHLEKTF